MNVVIYTNNFEPITVADIDYAFLDNVERYGVGQLLVLDPDLQAETRICRLEARQLTWWDSSVRTVFTTPDEETAMLLRCDWLPGQRAATNQYIKRIKSLTNALIKARRNDK